MATKVRTSHDARLRRHRRVRRKVQGSEIRPRLCVFRSLNHIYAQVVDDVRRTTVASASTLDSEVKDKIGGLPKMERAKLVGELVADRALSQGVTKVVFDRGGYRYHGRVRAVADAARSKGLEF